MTKNDTSTFKVKRLRWDSDYFNKEISLIEFKEEIKKQENNIIYDIIKKNNLTVFKNKKKLYKNNIFLGENTNAVLIDINVSFEKTNIVVDEKLELLKIENKFEVDEHILNLSKKAFEDSRFLKDKNLNKYKSNEVYTNWIINSKNNSNKSIIKYTEEGNCSFLLFSFYKDVATIELIAVDKKLQYRGIGTKLINTLNKFSIENGIKKIEVGTQLENINAINFYTKLGFKINDITYIYHCWE